MWKKYMYLKYFCVFILLLSSCSLNDSLSIDNDRTDEQLLGTWEFSMSDDGIPELAFDIEIKEDGSLRIIDSADMIVDNYSYEVVGSGKIKLSALGIEKVLCYDISGNDLKFYLDSGFNLYKCMNTIIEDETEGSDSTQQLTPTLIIITATPINPLSSDTPSINNELCPDSWPRRISIDDYAEVCTKTDRLIIRKSPGKDGKEITRIYPGTIVKILDGPICKEEAYWWKISVPEGTKVYYPSKDTNTILNDDLLGWVQEGGDEEDEFFICKVDE